MRGLRPDPMGDADLFVASALAYAPAASAVHPPPPMPVAMQAAFAASRAAGSADTTESSPLPRRLVGYDDSLASMPTSWELQNAQEAEALSYRPWLPPDSALFQHQGSAVSAAPSQPALVAVAITERRRQAAAKPSGPAARAAAAAKTPLTSWERESELLRSMRVAGAAAVAKGTDSWHQPAPYAATPETISGLRNCSAVSVLPSPSQISDLRRLVDELDAMWNY